MKLSDYIVSFLVQKKITDVFGYPGGMVTHLMDSFAKYKDSIKAHVNYHEQGASFSACGYGQTSNIPGVAYATSGPGATNLITGIANAFFDSIPCIFITGQVNTYELKDELQVRQRGFQETDIVSIVKPITKYSVQITEVESIRYELEKAFYISIDGRPGPVLLDVPMNIQRAEIEPERLLSYSSNPDYNCNYFDEMETILQEFKQSEKPVIIAGAGIRSAGKIQEFNRWVQKVKIPVITTMTGIDCIPSVSPYCFGFLGAYGHRFANFALAKCDLIISLGSRLDSRQTGNNKMIFAENAKLIRIEIDEGETTNKIKEDERLLLCDMRKLLTEMNSNDRFNFDNRYQGWLDECNYLKLQLSGIDNEPANALIKKISSYIPENAVITTDVGQNQVWVAQSFIIKKGQKVLFSGGHGAMGYSLPAAIGAYYASKSPVFSFNGDGGMQMNIQELQFIVRDQLPVKIFVVNNYSLGMIRHFQEMYFDSNFVQTTADRGYTTPDFCKVAAAYGLKTYTITDLSDCETLEEVFSCPGPALIHILCSDKTYAFPKVSMGKPVHDQDPLIDRELFDRLLQNKGLSI
jgi:Thiamine pyrophosphate-requiring enzymes [acetolactate synthase, pyruvate dehydrogenase (cytochrome), glyoxylate carboligase, phosphonopyruvate decarboxylase]